MDLAGVPWQKIHDYLLQLETAESRDKLLTLALANIDNRLVLTNRVYWNEFADSEFVTDFARPRGWARCIGQLQPRKNQKTGLCIQRTLVGRDFTESEVATLRVASVHLDNLITIFDKLSALRPSSFPREALLEAFPGLSSREADVARLFVLSRNRAGP